MSATVKQPVGQKRLTNIAVVRMKKCGNRFEIACYKNKVLSWRSGVEKDIDEVLQTHSVFSNVGKGTLAKAKDLMVAFGTDDEEVICRLILEKGELQVSDKERESHVSTVLRDITSIVVEKTVNPETGRPYTIGMVEKLIREVHFSVDPNKSSKQQALELIQKLGQKFPIARAKMELRLSVKTSEAKVLRSTVSQWNAKLVSEAENNGTLAIVCQVDPGLYRQCDNLMHEMGGRLEVVSLSVHKDGDEKFDAFDAGESASGRREKIMNLSEDVVETSGKPQLRVRQEETSVKVQKCTTCRVSFENSKLYREHFKSDWHKLNLKRKLKGVEPLGESEFEAEKDVLLAVEAVDEFSLK